MNPRIERNMMTFLSDAARWSRDEGLPSVDLATAPSDKMGVGYGTKRMMELETIAQKWEADGLGHVIPTQSGRPHFSFGPKAFAYIDGLESRKRRKAKIRRIASVNWNAVTAISSLIAAVAAGFAAYFSYLSMASN